MEKKQDKGQHISWEQAMIYAAVFEISDSN